MNRSEIQRLHDSAAVYLNKATDIRQQGRTDEDAMLIRQLASKLTIMCALLRTHVIGFTQRDDLDLFAAAHALFNEGYYIGPSNPEDPTTDGQFLVSCHIDGQPEYTTRGYFVTGDNLADLIAQAFDNMMANNACDVLLRENQIEENAIRAQLQENDSLGREPIRDRVDNYDEFVQALLAFQSRIGIQDNHRVALCRTSPERYPAIVEFMQGKFESGFTIDCVGIEYPVRVYEDGNTYKVMSVEDFNATLIDYQNRNCIPSDKRRQRATMPTMYPALVTFAVRGEHRDEKYVVVERIEYPETPPTVKVGRYPHTYKVLDNAGFSNAVLTYCNRLGLSPPPNTCAVINSPPSEFPAHVRFSIVVDPTCFDRVQCEVLSQGRQAPVEHHDTCRAVRNGTLPCDCGMDPENGA